MGAVLRAVDPESSHEQAFTQILQRIGAAAILQEPFPHIYIRDLLPPAYYRRLLGRISEVGKWKKVLYPGTGADFSAPNYKDHGLLLENFMDDPEIAPLYHFLRSERFARALLNKFSAPDSWGQRGPAIPIRKHRFFSDAMNCASVCDIQRDMPGYAIAPHPDTSTKIMTYLCYLTPDESLRQYGTFLCRPKPGVQVEAQGWPSLWVKIKRALTGGNYGVAQNDGWHAWEKFDIVKTAEAYPNSFVAFAPNSDSWHAVRMDIPPEHSLQERMTLRGFIRAGEDSENIVSNLGGGLLHTLMHRVIRPALIHGWARPLAKWKRR